MPLLTVPPVGVLNYNNGTHQRHVPGRLVPDTGRSHGITQLPGYRRGFGIMGEAISGGLRTSEPLYDTFFVCLDVTS